MDELTREQLLVLARQQAETIVQLTQLVHQLREQLDQLQRRRLGKPPPFADRTPRRSRPTNTRKPDDPSDTPA